MREEWFGVPARAGGSAWRGDVDIPSIDTPAAPAAIQIQGPITRARAKQLNYQVLSFLGTILHIHENMMLPKSDVYLLLRNNGPSKDGKDAHWSMITHGGEHKLVRDDTTDDMGGGKPI